MSTVVATEAVCSSSPPSGAGADDRSLPVGEWDCSEPPMTQPIPNAASSAMKPMDDFMASLTIGCMAMDLKSVFAVIQVGDIGEDEFGLRSRQWTITQELLRELYEQAGYLGPALKYFALGGLF